MPDWDLTDGRFRCIPRPRNATNILRLISTEAVSFELNSEVSPEKISCCFCCLFHRHHPIPRSALTHKNSRRANKNAPKLEIGTCKCRNGGYIIADRRSGILAQNFCRGKHSKLNFPRRILRNPRLKPGFRHSGFESNSLRHFFCPPFNLAEKIILAIIL